VSSGVVFSRRTRITYFEYMRGHRRRRVRGLGQRTAPATGCKADRRAVRVEAIEIRSDNIEAELAKLLG
jgi:hypothetical protein